MRNIILRAAGALLLTLPISSCFTVDHFTGDQTRYDGLYFGRVSSAPQFPPFHDEKWRNYAVFGLIPWDDEQTQFAGRRLAQVGSEQRPMRIAVTSELNLVNGLTSFGLALLTGPLGALFFVPRNVEVDGWDDM